MFMSDSKREKYLKLINRRIEQPDFFDTFFGGDDIIIKKIIDDGYSDLLINTETGSIKIAGMDVENQIYYNYFQKLLKDSPIDEASLKLFKLLSPIFDDVIEKNNRLYLIIDEDELPGFFDDSTRRDGSSAALVKNYYIGDIDSEPYDYFPSFREYYDYIIEDLNSENLNTLYEYMVKDGVIPVNDESPDELIELSKEQGRTDSVVLSIDILKQLDKDTFTFVLKTYFDEVYHDLAWRHNDASSDAWIDEVQSNIESELTRLFDHKIQRETLRKRNYFRKEYYTTVFEVDITEKFVEIIMNFLKENYNSGYHDDMLDYWGSFVKLYQEYIGRYEDLLTVRAPDYPDYGRVKKIFNELFLDII